MKMGPNVARTLQMKTHKKSLVVTSADPLVLEYFHRMQQQQQRRPSHKDKRTNKDCKRHLIFA